MFTKIREITNIGTFSNFRNGGNIPFSKLTLIFGLNCYGKSTLTDIFRSISQNDNLLLKNRKTIGSIIPGVQKINLTFFNENKEDTFLYTAGNWNFKSFDFPIDIFDSRFIDENIFTGLNITRDNKEKFTDFILGHENIILAQELITLKQTLSELKRKKKEKEKALSDQFLYKIPIQDFMNIKIERTLQEVSDDLHQLKKEKENIENNLKNVDTISQKKEPEERKIQINITEIIKSINQLLRKDYKDLNEEAHTKIKDHVMSNFKSHDMQEEQWIKKGIFSYTNLDDIENAGCPLCGQKWITSIQLLNTYQNYFSKTYQEFAKNVENELKTMLKLLNREISSLSIDLKEDIIVFKDYVPILKDPKYNNELQEVESHVIAVEQLLTKLKNESQKASEVIENKINDKIKKPYEELDHYDYGLLDKITTDFNGMIETYRERQSILIFTIKAFKDNLKNSDIQVQLESLSQKIQKLEIIKLRIQNDNNCNAVTMINKEIKEIEGLIPQKENEFEKSQNSFLEKYFNIINEIFSKFGSKDFEIKKVLPKRGYKPVVGLQIKYKGVTVNENNISYVISDSDRRALALSIFWAKLRIREEHELAKTVVVLDDPVTSFDDNRINYTIKEIFELIPHVRQVIILSHYDVFLKRMIDNIKKKFNYKILKIEKNHNTSLLEIVEPCEFVLSDHEKAFLNIEQFVNRESNDDISRLLRPFLEQELKNRFRKQINEYGLNNLPFAKLIAGLKENNIITIEIERSLYNIKDSLDKLHHDLAGPNIEDTRTFAQDLVNFIYCNLVPFND